MYRATQAACRISSRRVVMTRPSVRPQVMMRKLATQPAPAAASTGASHFVAGVAGGTAVLLAGYGYYRYSGAHKIVSAAQQTIDTAKAIQDKAPSPTQAGRAVVSAIRAVAPGFFKVVPGLDGVVDKGFEQLDQLAETHGDEVEELVNKLYGDLQKLAKKGFNEDTLKEAVELVQKRVKEAQQLAVKIGSDATDKVLASNPELKKSVQSGIEELKDMVDVPEVERILHDTYAELKKMADKGFSPESIAAAGLLVKTQVTKAKEVAGKAGDAAWDKAAEAAKPWLKKMPEVEKLLNGNIDNLKKIAKENGGPELEKIVTDMYSELKKISEKGVNKDSIAQATKVVETKVAEAMKLGGGVAGKATDFAWDKATEAAKPYLKKMPEVEKLLNGKLDDLKKIAKQNGGPELEKIVTDMYAELKKISEKGINKDTIAQATKVVEDKVAQATEIGSKAASKAGDIAWDKAAEVAKPYLKKMPEVQELIDDKLDDLKKIAKENGGPELEKIVTDMYSELKKISEKGVNKDSIAQAKKIVESKLAEAGKIGGNVADKAWQKAADAAQPLLDKAPEYKKLVESQMGDLQEIASKRGPEGEKLIEETYNKIAKIAEKGVSKSTIADMKKVLEDQASKAKKLAEKTADDVKK
ncbi:hypothetical protein DFJ77DRAFT_470032 [Powellomyces hirtus]|nr:hypothetical protein DFJ77DRAFT_470032 [Powellomyces hirtus]